MGAYDTNLVRICGTVIEGAEFDHRLFGETFYVIKVMVPRLSGTTDVLPVTLPGRACTELPEEGDKIHIMGQLRSYNKHTDNGSRLIISVFARTIEPADDECEAYNEITLSGYLCKPVMLRTTPFLREIGDILLAVNRSYNKSDYLPCIAWGRNARFAADLMVGSHMQLCGRLQSREYQKCLEDGTMVLRTAYEVSCSSLELL
ncbi:MAG: single-stranded DNA-binding protein [Clostridia bacterium]